MTCLRLAVVLEVLLALVGASPARASVTADLILSLHWWNTDRLNTVRVANARLLADVDPRPSLRFHLDLDRDEPDSPDLYEAYGEWSGPNQHVRLGRFQLPFGIYNRSELYYVGLIYDPLIHYYPYEGPHLADSANGLEYVRTLGAWQIEAAAVGRSGDVSGLVPSGGLGALRLQHFAGPLILGVSASRNRVPESAEYQGKAHFLGLDFRLSRPTWIVRGELVAGTVPGGSPRGFYVDVLYHPVALNRVTFVGRLEAVRGQPEDGGLFQRQTIGVKWDGPYGIAIALNQLFEPSQVRSGLQGTTLFVWYTHRL